MNKADKLFHKINMYFRTKDAKNNYSKEDEESEDFK
jgi:hypothetical protein